MTPLWFTWIRRSLAARWLSTLAIAGVVGLGVALFTVLQASIDWRTSSNEASFESLGLHDVRVSLGQGVFVPEGSLGSVVEPLVADGLFEVTEERLVTRTQVDLADSGPDVVVPGRLVSSGATVGGLQVDRLHTADGRLAEPGEVVIEHNFARFHEAPAQGRISLAGGRSVPYSGQVLSPEYYVITGEEAGLLAQSAYAVVFTDLATGQGLTARTGQVNEVVGRWAPGVDQAAAVARLRAEVDRELASVAAFVVVADDEESVRFLRNDVKQDEELLSLVSILILACASLAVANLVSRIVESQRREIGVGMAMGMTPSQLAARPLAFAITIAVFGTGFGWLLALVARPVLSGALIDLVPLPIWNDGISLAPFAFAGALGIGLPLLAATAPIVSLLRKPPVEVIRRGGHAGGALLGRLGRLVRTPGSPLAQLPMRNTLRSPRRTTLTLLGVGAAVTAMVGTVGMLDSMVHTTDVGETQMTRTSPDRVRVDLITFVEESSTVGVQLDESPVAQRVESGIRLDVGAHSASHGEPMEAVLQLQDLSSSLWVPVDSPPGATTGSPPLVLSRKMARQLDVRPGDLVEVEHLRFSDGTATTEQISSTFELVAVHGIPLRFLAYADLSDADVFGLTGFRNFAEIEPVAGTATADVVRQLSQVPGVASAQPVNAISEVFNNLLDTVSVVFRLLQIGVFLLACLVAGVSAKLLLEERQREHALLVASGVSHWRVMGIVIAETVVVGTAATLLGLVTGFAIVRWTMRDLLADSLPEIDLLPYLSVWTIVAAGVLGIVAGAATPLLSRRRLVRLSLTETLRTTT